MSGGLFLDRFDELRMPWVVILVLGTVVLLSWAVVAGSMRLSTHRGRFIVTTPTGERFEVVEYIAYDGRRIGITTADGRELIIRGDSTVEEVTRTVEGAP